MTRVTNPASRPWPSFLGALEPGPGLPVQRSATRATQVSGDA
jgi:hypothetical protein